MKIIYCINSISHLGGIARVVIAKANALAAIEGNEVWIAYTDVDEKHPEPVFPLDKRVRTIDLGIRYYAKDQLGLYYRIESATRLRHRHKKALEKALAPIKPDVIISVGQSEKYLVPSLKLPRKPALVREFHYAKDYRRYVSTSLIGRIKAWLTDLYDYGWKIRRYDAIAVLTHEDFNRNWAKTKIRDKVHVIPNPLTGGKGILLSDLSSKTVVTIGRVAYQKNHESLIRAWSKVTKSHPDWKLCIYGDGDLYTNLKAQIMSMDLTENVYAPGAVRNASELLAQSSIFALTSRYEGFPLVIPEASAAGVPTVSYKCPCGPSDIITDGVDGYLVETGDEDTMADRICCLIEDESLRKQMGDAALKSSERFTPQKVADMWMNLFNSIQK